MNSILDLFPDDMHDMLIEIELKIKELQYLFKETDTLTFEV